MAEFTKGQVVYLRDAPSRYRRQRATEPWGGVREAQVRMLKGEFVYLAEKAGKFDPDFMEIEDSEGQVGTRVFRSRQEAEEYPEVLREWEALSEFFRTMRQPSGVFLSQVREAARLLGAKEE